MKKTCSKIIFPIFGKHFASIYIVRQTSIENDEEKDSINCVHRKDRCGVVTDVFSQVAARFVTSNNSENG
jgi:hypothetical protein